MSELKPCPFCGGKAERTDCIGCCYIQIKCVKCGANITLVVGSEPTKTEKATVVRRWNRRVSDD